jgi:hypothetical protein
MVNTFVVDFSMRTLDKIKTVEDTEENAMICAKYCGSCPTFKRNNLANSPPGGLFCARGKSSRAQDAKPVTCYCPACELFTRHELAIGYFCTKG